MLSGTSCDDVTDYVIASKKSLLEKVSKLDKNSFDIMSLSTMPQFRTIRRIVGKTNFCAVDCQEFEDSIGSCGDFRPDGIGRHYQIPLAALYNENFPNFFLPRAELFPRLKATAGKLCELSRSVHLPVKRQEKPRYQYRAEFIFKNTPRERKTFSPSGQNHIRII